jgi:hypothetical protein
MKKISVKEITIKLPTGVAESVSAEELVSMVMDKALTMAEYYRSRCKEYEQKYGMDFGAFKKKVESAGAERASEWDDMLVWEGFELAYQE